MSPHYPLSYEDVHNVLQEAEVDAEPAYLHGLWCGLIIGGQYCSPQDWMDIAFDEVAIWGELDAAVQLCLLRLAEYTVTQMKEFDFSFELLLPKDESVLQERAYALNEWCIGFVMGVQHQREQQTLLSGDGAHALSDISKISEMEFGTEESEEEEISYTELVEFVRIAVLTVHQNLLEGAAQRSRTSPPYLH